MTWVKRGHIFAPEVQQAQQPWAVSHAQVPLAMRVNEATLRIYFGTRDSNNRTLTTFIEVDSRDPTRVTYKHPEPILPLGAAGTFDDSGVMPSDIVTVNGRTYFYYVGWNTGHTARYRTALGLAISDDGGRTFRKVAEGPIMDRDMNDPIGVSCQSVLVENGLWRTWYMSYRKWQERDGKMEPYYEVKYATSEDGVRWHRPNVTCIPLAGDEGGIACPSVVRDGDGYRMWYSVRGSGDYRNGRSESYRIGYAQSRDGLVWNRMDDLAGLEPSADGWDSEMVAYPYVLQEGTRRLMFYNGNGFGKTGFGFAEYRP